METIELWQAWQQQGDEEARDRLVRSHLRLVHHVAGQLIRSGPTRGMEIDDLVSAGTIGLLHAIQSFEPERGLAFSTFATPRIRGAILDDLRRQDAAPRSVRRKQRDLSRARERLSSTLNRAPTDEEVAVELGVDQDQLRRWELDADSGTPVALDPLQTDRVTHAPVLSSQEQPADESLGHREEVQILTQAIQELRHPDRLVVSLYYHEGLRMHQIAEVLGVTESRVSQIRSRALKELRAQLAHLRD